MIQLVQAAIDGILANMIALGARFDPAATFIEVDTAIAGTGVATTSAAITAATGAMATRKQVTPWSAVYHEGDGRAVVDGPLLQFEPASSAEAQTLVGFSLWSAATGGVLLGYGMFASPVTLPDQTRRVSIVPRLTVDPNGRWSTEIMYV